MKLIQNILAEAITPYLSGRETGAEHEVAGEVIETLRASGLVLAKCWDADFKSVTLAPVPEGVDATKMVYVVQAVNHDEVTIQAIHPEDLSA